MSEAFAALLDEVRQRGDAVALRTGDQRVPVAELLFSFEVYDPLLIDGVG